jgi:hypothetical protein
MYIYLYMYMLRETAPCMPHPQVQVALDVVRDPHSHAPHTRSLQDALMYLIPRFQVSNVQDGYIALVSRVHGTLKLREW